MLLDETARGKPGSRSAASDRSRGNSGGSRTGHITPELFQFLTQLKRHNDRAWFARNKQRYLEDVQEPVLRFVADAGGGLREISTHLVADPGRQVARSSQAGSTRPQTDHPGGRFSAGMEARRSGHCLRSRGGRA